LGEPSREGYHLPCPGSIPSAARYSCVNTYLRTATTCSGWLHTACAAASTSFKAWVRPASCSVMIGLPRALA